MLTCDACDWTAPCVVVQPALSVSVACSLACRIACSLVQLHAAPVDAFLRHKFALEITKVRDVGGDGGEIAIAPPWDCRAGEA